MKQTNINFIVIKLCRKSRLNAHANLSMSSVVENNWELNINLCGAQKGDVNSDDFFFERFDYDFFIGYFHCEAVIVAWEVEPDFL